MTLIPPISQSLIKAMREYQAGTRCGLVIEAEWIKGMRMPTSDAARLGQWFEWKALGNRNYYGEIPEPDYLAASAKDRGKAKSTANLITKHGGPQMESRLAMVERWKKAKAKERGELSEEYKRAETQADNFNDYLKEYRWEIIGKGEKILDQALQMSVSLDAKIRIPKNGYWPFSKTMDEAWKTWSEEKSRIVLDLKYSGLIDAGGWTKQGWNIETLPESDYMLQPSQYSIVTGLKGFVFMVFSPGKDMDCKLFPVVTYPNAERDHLQAVEETRNQLKSAVRAGFQPHPSFKRCKDCPIAEGCKYRVTVPEAEIVISQK